MTVAPDLDARLAALEARVRELEAAAAKHAMPLSAFELAQPIRSPRLPSIFIGPEWLGPRSYE